MGTVLPCEDISLHTVYPLQLFFVDLQISYNPQLAPLYVLHHTGYSTSSSTKKSYYLPFAFQRESLGYLTLRTSLKIYTVASFPKLSGSL